MAMPSSESLEPAGTTTPGGASAHAWPTLLRSLARLWEDSIHESVANTLQALELQLEKLGLASDLPEDLAVATRLARLSIQGLDTDTADAGMLRQYIFSCINELLVRAMSLRVPLKQVGHADAPRVFVLDPRQNMAIACSIQMRAFGLNALSLFDETELEKALTRWTPAALITVADGVEDPEAYVQQIRHWRSLVGNACYCIFFTANDTLQWRRLAAQADFDLFVAGQQAHHEMGVHINAWIRQQNQQERLVLIGSADTLVSTRKQWESLGVSVSIATDIATAWSVLAAQQPDGVIVHGDQLQQHPELLPMLRQSFSDELLWAIDYSLAGSALDVNILYDRREDHYRAKLALSRNKFRRLLQQEENRYDLESGLLKLEPLFERALPMLQRRAESEDVVVFYLRFEGLEERLPIDNPLQRAFFRQNAAAALLARLNPGDLLGAVGDQNYLMLLRSHSARSLTTFSENLAQLPVADGVVLKIGMAPVHGIHLSRAIKEAVSGLQIPHTDASSQAAPTGENDAPQQDWTLRLKSAIQEKRLFLAFQSIVSLDNDLQERYEVLLRLKEREATIEPREFISIARQSGLIRYLDRWVVAEALKTLKLRQGKVAKTGLFIKVSNESVLDPGFLPWMQRVITASGASLENSAIEVEEGVFFTHVGEGKVFVEKLREINVPVCIAQFGRSDASLNLIDYCSPAFIKLHRQYSLQLGQDKRIDQRFDALVARAKQAGTHLLVGYLESTQALYRAVQTGAPMVQGNVLHRPSKVMEFDYSIVMKG